MNNGDGTSSCNLCGKLIMDQTQVVGTFDGLSGLVDLCHLRCYALDREWVR